MPGHNWSWNMLAFVGGGREESVSMRESPLDGDLAVVPMLPAQAVPVARWPQMADPSVILPPAPSLAVLTPLDMPEAPWPPLSLSPPVGAAPVGGAIIPLEHAASAAQRLELPVAGLLGPPPATQWWGPVAAQVLELLATMLGLLVAQLLEVLYDLLQDQLPPAGAPLLLEQRGGAAAARLLLGPPLPPAAGGGGGAPLLLGPPAAAPLMILPAAPPLEQPAAPLLVGPPAAALLRILPAAPQLERPAAPMQVIPAAAPLVAPPAALLMILPAAPPLLEPPVPAVFGAAILLGPAVAPRLIMPAFPRLIIPAAPRLEQPAAPIPPALPVAPLPQAPDAVVAVPLDAVNWSCVAKTFAVMDLRESDSVEMPKRGWGGVIDAAMDGLAVACSSSEKVAVRWVLTEATELYPCTGFFEGSEYAALAIYRGVRADKEVALRVFVKWASPPAWFQRSTVNGYHLQLEKGLGHSWKVLRNQSPAAHIWLGDQTMTALYADLFLSAVSSLCTRQGLPGHVVHDIIQKTLEAGNNGPAVSLWVMHSLLHVAEEDCKRNRDATPDLCIRSRLVSAGQTVATFEDLGRHAPMTLSSFVRGYEAAVFGRGR